LEKEKRLGNILVSVICITYNQKEYLNKAIDSILNQKTEIAFELIIHDDVSTDGTTDIVKDIKNKYPDKVQVIYENENQFSQNKDFFSKIIKTKARGKYIALCEGDDYWIDNNKLQMQYNALEAHPECDMCACRAVMVSADEKNMLGEIRPQKGDGILSIEEVILGGGNFVASAGLFFRKKMFDEMLEFEKIRSLDYSHQIKGAMRGGIYYIDKVMVAYRRYSNESVTCAITTNKDMMNVQCEQEKAILRTFDKETKWKYHEIIEYRIEVYDISCCDQLMEHKDEICDQINGKFKNIYIWGSGVRGKELEKFCGKVGISIKGVCDITNKKIGEYTQEGNRIESTDYVKEKADLIIASVEAAYTYIKENINVNAINMQKYMPRI